MSAAERYFVDVAPDRRSWAVYDSQRPDPWTGAVVCGVFTSREAAVVSAEGQNRLWASSGVAQITEEDGGGAREETGT